QRGMECAVRLTPGIIRALQTRPDLLASLQKHDAPPPSLYPTFYPPQSCTELQHAPRGTTGNHGVGLGHQFSRFGNSFSGRCEVFRLLLPKPNIRNTSWPGRCRLFLTIN